MTHLMDPYLKGVWVNTLLFVLLPNNIVGYNYSTAVASYFF